MGLYFIPSPDREDRQEMREREGHQTKEKGTALGPVKSKNLNFYGKSQNGVVPLSRSAH